MNIENVEKKQREARFFLSKMIEQESRAFGEREPFDFYLSAFLSASRSIDYRLRHEQAVIYPAWRNSWNSTLAASDDQLMKYMADDRILEVHESGSGRNATVEYSDIPGSTYSDDSGVLTVFAPPGTPLGTIGKPAYYFTIGGANRRVTEACTDYLALLDRMVTDFKAANP
jgi:hypothetical protein